MCGGWVYFSIWTKSKEGGQKQQVKVKPIRNEWSAGDRETEDMPLSSMSHDVEAASDDDTEEPTLSIKETHIHTGEKEMQSACSTGFTYFEVTVMEKNY